MTTKYHNTHKINRIDVKLEVKIVTIADTPETLLTLSNTKVLNKVQAGRLCKKKNWIKNSKPIKERNIIKLHIFVHTNVTTSDTPLIEIK